MTRTNVRRHVHCSYRAVWRWVGHRHGIGRNRFSRYAYIASLRAAEHVFGIPDDRPTVRLPGGLVIGCDLRDNLQADLYYLGSYASAELDILRTYMRPGDAFLDVGAHIGLFSLDIGRYVGSGGVVFAFEPSPDSAAQLRLNIQANGLEGRIQVYELALADRQGTMELRASEARPADPGMRSLFGAGEAVSTVAVWSLDDALESGEVRFDRPIDAIKIDIEGAEVMCIRGMRRLLVRDRPRVVVAEAIPSLLARAQNSLEELDREMEGVGYRRRAAVGPSRGRAEPNATYVPVQW